MTQIAADRTGIGLHRHGLEAHARKGVEIGHEHAVIGFARRLLVQVEGIGVLHQEFAAPHDAEARADLVAEFPLDVVEQLGQVLVGAAIGPEELGDHLLIGRPVQHLAIMAVGDAQHLLAVIIIAPALAPQIGRLDGRHQELDSAGPVLLLADDLLDLVEDFQTERQPGVDARRLLLDHAGTQHQLVRHDLRVGGGFFQNRQEKAGQAHEAIPVGSCVTPIRPGEPRNTRRQAGRSAETGPNSARRP